METPLTLAAVCEPSDGVVSREIEGEIIIVPLVSGIGDVEDELYTLNETGKAIWQKLDGQRSLKDVAAVLASEFNAPSAELENNVLGFVSEMARRGMISVTRTTDTR